MPEGDWQRLHAIVSGRVQGVNFRAFTRREAEKLKLTGWVKNRSNGSVETVAEGSQEVLLQYLEYLHRGSPSANVTLVEVEWDQATGEFSGFEVGYF